MSETFSPIPNFVGANAGQSFRAAVNAALGGSAPISISDSNGTLAPTTGQSLPIPANQIFTGVNPAGALAALTLTLPSTFPQGQTCELVITQAITALTIAAPGGTSIVGTAITGAASQAGLALAYRLQGTTWYRTK